MYKRICPNCNNDIWHNGKGNRDEAVRKGRLCKTCMHRMRDRSGPKNPFYGKTHTEETKRKIAARDMSFAKDPKFIKRMSEVTSGANNPNYGVSNYQRWVKKYGVETADELEAQRKKKLSICNSGCGNPMFGKETPHGSGNGWSGWYKGWYFRSLHELSYMINHIEKNNLKWSTAECKNLEIPYLDWNGNKRTYRADFLIDDKILVEVKPYRLRSSRSVKTKMEAALIFCQERGLEYEFACAEKLSSEQIRELHKVGEIKFLPRYETKFKEKFNE